jgi:signal transduction histidine kinase
MIKRNVSSLLSNSDMTRILVIEDERGLRDDMVDALNMSAFDVIAASDGEQGLELARQQHPDVILCDLRMPVMDGFQVLQHLREDTALAVTPVILITAQNDRDTMRSAMKLGADDFITKPFSVEELLSAVEARLERRNTFVRDAEGKLEQAKLRLTRMIAHELKTPLISMQTVIEVVNRRMGGMNDQDLGDMLASMDAGGRRLNHLVEQMVLVTQLDSGVLQRATLAQQGVPANMSDLFNSAITLGRRFCSTREDVTIVAEDFDVPYPVLCHPQAIKHALAELIANALKFSPQNGRVTVGGWKSGRAVWVTITDCGAGMSPEQLEQIGAAFTQIERDMREQQGMGMGLMLAQRIIKLHGGIMELRSVLGQGTQAQVGLPVMPAG